MKKSRIILFCLLLCSLALRLAAYWLEPVLSRDSCTYIVLAEKIAEAGDFNIVLTAFPQITTPPLFLSLTVLLMRCGLSAEIAAVSINIACGTLVPFLFASIVRLLFRSAKMFWCVLLLAICHPVLIRLSAEAQRDMMYLLFAGLFCLLLCLACIRRNIRYCAGAGGVFALCALTRYETLEFIPFLILSGIAVFCKKKVQLKTAIFCTASFFTAVFLCCWLYIQFSGSGPYLKKHYINYCRLKMNSVLHAGGESRE